MTLHLNPADIPVVILCGGMGTRIREASEQVPKPMIDIGGKPVLWHLMKVYRHHGHRKFILCAGYLAWKIKEFWLRYREQICDFTIDMKHDYQPVFLDGRGTEDWNVTVVDTGIETGTAARLRRVAELIDSETFCFTYGDGLGSVDVTELVKYHQSHGALATVTGVKPSSRYGEITMSGEDVLEFNEKPTASLGSVSGGFFVLERGVLDYLDDDQGSFFETGPLPKIARDGQLRVFHHQGFWMGMDTYRDWLQLNGLWESGDAPWKVWTD